VLMSGFGTPLLVVVFVLAAGATWLAGNTLSRTTDSLDFRLTLGDELGGLLLLSIAGSLPELAITVSAAASGHLDLAAGNLIGGIAVQTMVLVVCDFAVGPNRPLTFLVGALSPVLEGLLVVLVVSGVLMGSLLKPSTAIGGVVSPASVGIVVAWLIGVYVINRVRRSPRWRITMEGSRRGRRNRREPMPNQSHPYASRSTGPARRQRARARRHLRRQRVPALPVPGRRPRRRDTGPPGGGQPERVAGLARRRADGDLRDGGDHPAAPLPAPTGPRLDLRDRPVRRRHRRALRRSEVAWS